MEAEKILRMVKTVGFRTTMAMTMTRRMQIKGVRTLIRLEEKAQQVPVPIQHQFSTA